MQVPPMIQTDESNDFAHHTMSVRLPGILSDVQEANPDYPMSIQRALSDLREGMVNDAPIPMLDLPAPDYDDWYVAYTSHHGDTWLNTEWFFGETFLYRHVIQAVRWWDTRRDPFQPIKAEEYQGEALWQLLGAALAADIPTDERLADLIDRALWGNRMDLSFQASLAHGGESVHEDDLLVDDRFRAVEYIMSLPEESTVHIIADNAGTELTMDLVLADMLLSDVAGRVIVHLKLHPTFVSDATVEDVLSFLDMLESGGRDTAARRFGQRLRAAIDEGRLRLAPDLYWNSSRLLWDMPPRLAAIFQNAGLVFVKGDANYRRMLGDAIWAVETPFDKAVGYFPAPLVAVRTLKSEPLVGLSPQVASRLDHIDEQWRVNGKRGVIQFALPDA